MHEGSSPQIVLLCLTATTTALSVKSVWCEAGTCGAIRLCLYYVTSRWCFPCVLGLFLCSSVFSGMTASRCGLSCTYLRVEWVQELLEAGAGSLPSDGCQEHQYWICLALPPDCLPF